MRCRIIVLKNIFFCRCLCRKLGREQHGVEELGEGGDEESRDRDKERADATPAARWRHPEHPAGMDATGELTEIAISVPLTLRSLHARRRAKDERRILISILRLPLFRMRGAPETRTFRAIVAAGGTRAISVACIRSNVRIRYTRRIGTHVSACTRVFDHRGTPVTYVRGMYIRTSDFAIVGP